MAPVWKYLCDATTILFCACKGYIFRFRKWLGWSLPDAHAIEKLQDSINPSQVTYSQVWEDTRTLRRAMDIQPGDRVICVSSGGDNAFSLLLDQPQLVLAVDFCVGQVAVAELKRLAIKHLTFDRFRTLVGMRPDDSDGDESAVEIYVDHMKPHLPAWLADFWDRHIDLIINGLLHAGLYEQYFKTFGEVVRPLAHTKDTVHKLLSCADAEAQVKFYDEVLDTWLWRWLVRLYFGDVLVGRCPAFYERANVNVGQHFLERLKHVMRNKTPVDNHYLEYALTGELTGRFGLPDYFQRDNFDILKSRIDNLRFVQGDLVDLLQKTEVHFDAIDLSNIFDFIPESDHGRYKQTVLEHAGPGTRIVHWTFVPVSDDRLDWRPFGDESWVDEQLSRNLNLEERAWFYQTFVVQFVSQTKPATKPHRPRNGVKKNGFSKPH